LVISTRITDSNTYRLSGAVEKQKRPPKTCFKLDIIVLRIIVGWIMLYKAGRLDDKEIKS
jgi:hypothetical protein